MERIKKDDRIQELDKISLQSTNGGGPLLELVAWLYGFAEGRAQCMAANNNWDDVDWEKMRALYE